MKEVKRNVDTEAMVAILNYWRKGNDLGELKLDAHDMLTKWIGAKKFIELFEEIDGHSKASENKSVSNDHIIAVVDRMYEMLNDLCYCEDPELEYVGCYARYHALHDMGGI